MEVNPVKCVKMNSDIVVTLDGEKVQGIVRLSNERAAAIVESGGGTYCTKQEWKKPYGPCQPCDCPD